MIPVRSSLGKAVREFKPLSFRRRRRFRRPRPGDLAVMILFALDALVDLFAVDSDVLRGVDSDRT